MYCTRSIPAILFFVIALGVANSAFASEDSPSISARSEALPSSLSSQESIVLRQVAIALAGGNEAMRALRGRPDDQDHRDRLQPSIPGMDCGIDRALSYLSCSSRLIDNKKEAETVFAQLVQDIEAALPSDRWRPIKPYPVVRSVQNIGFIDRQTGAQIDVDLILEPALKDHSYVIWLYGWTRI